MKEISRQEGEFWKLLALDIKKLGELIKDQECAIKELNNSEQNIYEKEHDKKYSSK